MIRITGGKFKQKKLASINDFVRPTSSLKREAFFSIIESYAIKNSIELYKNKKVKYLHVNVHAVNQSVELIPSHHLRLV